jgi:hypothetical protein
MFWTATKTMLAAMSGSTIPLGRRNTSSAESVSVSVCASVNALTTLIRSHSVVAASTSAPMKSRWS